MGGFGNIKGLKDISTIGVASIAGSGISAIFWIYLAALMGAENYGELGFYISIASVATSISFIGGPAAITVLVAKKIKIESMGKTFASEIKAVVPVLSGSHHLVWITNGLYEFEGHTNFISQSEKNDVKLHFVFDDFDKGTGWEAKEFFNETKNSWSLKNFSEAVKLGQKMCLEN